MGYQDRSYSRSGGGGWNPLMWVLSGSMPLFRVFGISVRAHSTLVLYIGLTLLIGAPGIHGLQDRLTSMTLLFSLVLLHEFGHCFACRAVGGTADDILMHPLGGLAFCQPPRRPIPSLITTIGGPAVNVVFVLISGTVCYALDGAPPWNPFHLGFNFHGSPGQLWYYYYAWWFFVVNYFLLLFNLLPSFPLDGGRILQEVLWLFVGYYRSMMIATTIGIGGAVGFAVWGLMSGSWVMIGLAVFFCLPACLQLRAQVKAAGPYAFDQDNQNFSDSVNWKPQRESGATARDEARARRERAEEEAEQVKIDAILEKVGRSGMHSLSWLEKRTLQKATERQRQRTLRRRP